MPYQPVQLYQLIIAALGMLIVIATHWVMINKKIAVLEKSDEFKQIQIDELKEGNSEVKKDVQAIKDDIGEMKGDLKVIRSKLNA